MRKFLLRWWWTRDWEKERWRRGIERQGGWVVPMEPVHGSVKNFLGYASYVPDSEQPPAWLTAVQEIHAEARAWACRDEAWWMRGIQMAYEDLPGTAPYGGLPRDNRPR